MRMHALPYTGDDFTVLLAAYFTQSQFALRQMCRDDTCTFFLIVSKCSDACCKHPRQGFGEPVVCPNSVYTRCF